MTDTSRHPEVQARISAYGAETNVGLVGLRTAHADTDTRHVGNARWMREREGALNSLLAPGATRSYGAGNRAVEEEPDLRRTCFERDLDRIKYSEAFRTLAGKCQVFVAPRDELLRNRLSHAIEVAQVALGVAQVAGLHLALTEAIALGHDCGHGPGGHASEEAFDPFLPGGYDHAPYGADVVLAPLNLTLEVLDGIRNHSWKRPAPSTPEGELVSWADRIAYVCHDFDDAVRAGIVTPAHLPDEVADIVGVRHSDQLGAFIGHMVDTLDRTGRIGMSDSPVTDALDAFRRFNYERIYTRPASRAQDERVIKLLRGIVEYFIDAPGQVPHANGADVPLSGTQDAATAAVRHVAGMTDRAVLKLGVEILGWSSDQLPRGV